jgi:hypothetical protein
VTQLFPGQPVSSLATQKGTIMKHVLGNTVAALALSAFALTPTANATPTGPSTVDAMIDSLQAQGFDVVVNRTGDGASALCTVAAVRAGHTYSRTDSGAPGAQDDLVTTLLSKTVYVKLSC